MPELPEVETIRAGLAHRVRGLRVEDIVGGGPRMFRNNPGGFDEVRYVLEGASLSGVERRGKFLWLPLVAGDSAPKDPSLVVHLGMSGQVHWQSPNTASPGLKKHEHLWVKLSDGSALSFVDQRTFGHLTASPLVLRGSRLVPELMGHIAPDPFEQDFSPSAVAARGSKSTRAVKTLLLDQEVVSGIGNIYADEALYEAQTNGRERGSDLSAVTWEKILHSAQAVMASALESGGTSFDSLYVDVEGNPGYFSRRLAVYRRSGRPCKRCGATIERTVVGGRSTHFCPRCQPAPVTPR